ncbi:aspartate-semialdehyde dehydrogenase [Thermogladius sp. 4427co]|uniref:aspartate-semialdehyde dehydrogenase n=1 Tax=Thermogladius sp. 4427co TaxID=3450718 RepID=UPI003F7AF058
MMKRVAILGATGLVGQRFIQLLYKHPWFEIAVLQSSGKSAGKTYGESVKWVIDTDIPVEISQLPVEPLNAESIVKEGIDIVFSALPSEIATDVEKELARRGLIVISNASPMRMEPDIPLINPEVNADHIEVLEIQRKKRGWSGAIVKVPNCTTSIFTLSLKPLYDDFGVKRVVVSSMQAISGAGLTGLPSMFIMDNLIPYIEGEEEKVEEESTKIFGSLGSDGILHNNNLLVSASCHRVMVLEGHTIAVFAELEKKNAAIEDIVRAMEEFKGNKIKGLNLPTQPEKPIIVRRELDRPQPRLDRYEGRGMSVVVGRIRHDKVFNGVKYIVLGSNTIRGAAGNGVLIAELLVRKGLV